MAPRSESGLLLKTLKQLGKSDLKTFQWHLIKGDVLDGFCSIPKAELEFADREDTVDKMVETYTAKGAVKITLAILKEIRQVNLAEKLNDEYTAGGPGQVGEAGAGRGSSAVQPITISAQNGAFVFSPIMTGNTVGGSIHIPTGSAASQNPRP
ncbi:caspase b-like isoform X1 [Oncorhynchus tshawytscha]|uniref:caspase b-like isoform X1 n=1 Tax=Oncorhynchus tshawytscha TaxID=74940 RepID=UPI001C3E603E|nr:caspase b-like isoform X1 [Oncorhynchus tshawytscha]